MEHIDPDALALHALGDTAGGDAPDREAIEAHLRGCAACAAELEALRSAVRIGRVTLDADRLVEPSPAVWDRIAAELRLEPGVAAAGPGAIAAAPDVGVASGGPAAIAGGTDATAPRDDLAAHRARARRPRWIIPIAAAAAVLVAATVGVFTWRALAPAEVLASARLEALPQWPGSGGEATLERRSDGTLAVHVELDAPPAPDGYRELWLLNADATDLVSLGVLDDREGTFTVPQSVDLAEFDVVDVSAERADGDPGHSGDSIVRGALKES